VIKITLYLLRIGSQKKKTLFMKDELLQRFFWTFHFKNILRLPDYNICLVVIMIERRFFSIIISFSIFLYNLHVLFTHRHRLILFLRHLVNENLKPSITITHLPFSLSTITIYVRRPDMYYFVNCLPLIVQNNFYIGAMHVTYNEHESII